MSSTNNQSTGPPFLRIRRVPLDFGLLPFTPPTHIDNVNSLLALKHQLFSQSKLVNGVSRVFVPEISNCLGLSELQSQIIVDTLASILPDDVPDPDPLAVAPTSETVQIGADIHHLLLFLQIQSYKRATHRPLPSSSALADVWPQAPSPFDSVLSTTPGIQRPGSPLHSRSRPGGLPTPPTEDEANELSFIHKNLQNFLTLISDQGEEGLVISQDKFERLNFLLKPPEVGDLLGQRTPFFGNSDADMPAVPVPLEEASEWLLQHVKGTSSGDSGGVQGPEEGTGFKGSGPSSNTIDGASKTSILRGEKDILSSVTRISHCHDAVIYMLAPLKYTSIIGCSDSIIVLGPVGKVVKVENCERVTLICPTSRVKISYCRECVFYLGVNSKPLLSGDNHKLQVAPYNTFYPKLEAHMQTAGVDPAVNQWDNPITLKSTDGHEAMDLTTGSGETQAERVAVIAADKFVPFVIPFRSSSESLSEAPTRGNPFSLPKKYFLALQHKTKNVEILRQTLKMAVLDENKKRELTNVIQAHFKEWLLSSGNIRQVYDLTKLDKEL